MACGPLLGWLQVIPAFEEAIVGMKPGGVRRIIVPVELGYPGQPPDFNKLGPAPGNFSVSLTLQYHLGHVCPKCACQMYAQWPCYS